MASPPLAHALARWLPSGSQPRAQALVNAAPGVGIALSGPIALLAVERWRLAWLGFAAIAAVVTAWTALAVPAHGRRRGGHPARLGADLLAVATGRGAWRLAAAAGLFGAASAATWTFARDHLATELGQTTSILAWIVLGVAGLAAAIAGDVIARHGLERVWRASLVALAAATAALGVLPASATTAFAAMAVFGAAYTTLTIAVFFAALHRHPGHPAATVGFGFVMITIGQALAAPLAGALVDLTDTPAAFLTFAALAVSTTLLRVTSHHPKLTKT